MHTHLAAPPADPRTATATASPFSRPQIHPAAARGCHTGAVSGLPRHLSDWLRDTMVRNRSLFQGWTMEIDPDAGNGGGNGDGDDPSGGDPDNGRGFPDNTPVDQMTVEQQAAYHRHQARRHEDRNKELLRITGGRYGDDLRADLDELARLREQGLTNAERAVAEARREAETATRTAVAAEFATKLVRAEFRAALAHVDGDRRDQIIEGLNLSAYVTDGGEVDTDKVNAYATTIAPADKGEGAPDYGAGRRRTPTKTGVAAGAEMFAQSRTRTSTTN